MVDKVKLKIILLQKGKTMRGLAEYIGISTPIIIRSAPSTNASRRNLVFGVDI